MKANEAPEKIYVHFSKNIKRLCASTANVNNNIEYTRTDAFIDKAFGFFGEHLCEYIDVKNANCGTYINIDGDKLKEDFKNYMKGE